MHYNPFAYIHSEKDILKLVTCLIANTTGSGQKGDEFWTNAEKLLYMALIGYIHYEAPEEEQNFGTMLEMLNSMEVREDDEEFKNPVDCLFDELKAKVTLLVWYIRSAMPMTDTMEDSLMTVTNSLPSAGRMFLMARDSFEDARCEQYCIVESGYFG